MLGHEGLKAIGVLPKLISLQLHKAEHISLDQFLQAFQIGKSENLVNFSIAGCKNMDNEFASAIALLFPHIEVLSLAFVEGITDKGLEIILKQCPSLRHLDIYGMKNINGSSFICIPQHTLLSLVIEKICVTEKEDHLSELLKLDPKLHVLRTNTWKIGETYMCSLLQ